MHEIVPLFLAAYFLVGLWYVERVSLWARVMAEAIDGSTKMFLVLEFPLLAMLDISFVLACVLAGIKERWENVRR